MANHGAVNAAPGFVHRLKRADGITTTTVVVVVPDATSTGANGSQITVPITTDTDIQALTSSRHPTAADATATASVTSTSTSAASGTTNASSTSAAAASSTGSHSSSSANHTGAIAAVASIIGVLALFIGGWILYKKFRARQSATSFKNSLKDEDFGNSANGPSLATFGFGNAEKYGAYGSLDDETVGLKRGVYEPMPEPLPATTTYPPTPSPKNSPRSPFEDKFQAYQAQRESMSNSGSPSSKSIPAFTAPSVAHENSVANLMMKPPTPTIVEPPASNPFDDQHQPDQGGIHPVVASFDPAQDDELTIFPGDHIQILATYDDGWALGINLSSGTPPQKGVFPFDCVGPALDSSKARSLPPQRPSRPPSSATPGPSFNTVIPPLSFSPTSPMAPSIQISSEDDVARKPRPMTLTIDTDRINKRSSSLASSRAASLLGALGDVLDEKKSSHAQ